MITPVALWARGTVDGRTVHLVETEDGVPRSLELPDGTAWASVCRTATQPRLAGPDAARRCPRCAAIDTELRPPRWGTVPLSA